MYKYMLNGKGIKRKIIELRNNEENIKKKKF